MDSTLLRVPSADGGRRQSSHAEHFDRLTRQIQPAHELILRRLSETADGRAVLAAHEELATQVEQLAERAKSDENSRLAIHEIGTVMEKFRSRHATTILAVAAEAPEMLPSVEMFIPNPQPSDLMFSDALFAEVLPLRGILIRRPPDDASSTSGGLAAPAPPAAVSACWRDPYPSAYGHDDSGGLASGNVLNIEADVSGGVEMHPCAWPPGSISGHAIVGGNEMHVPAGLSQFAVDVTYSYEYAANCWSFMALTGVGLDFMAEFDPGDGTGKRRAYTSLLDLHSYVAGGSGASESATRKVTFQFRRDSSQAGKVNVMAGWSGHADAGGSPFSGYAGVDLTGLVKEICVRSL